VTEDMKLPTVVVERVCSGCGYMVTQKLIDAARANFECPRCREYRFDAFIPRSLPPLREEKP